MTKKRRLGLMVIVAAAGVMTFGAVAFADGGKGNCEGKAQARFAEKDKNGDGFLTAAEVGDQKWTRIKVADANNDAKVSLAEMQKAKADGKLGHKGKGKKKKDTAA